MHIYQAIKDIKKRINIYKSKDKCKEVLQLLIDSSKYYFNDYYNQSDGVYSVFDSYKKSNKVEGIRPFIDLHTFCKLPTPLMSIEFKFNYEDKCVSDHLSEHEMLVMRMMGDLLVINAIGYEDESRMWMVLPFDIYISIGKPLIQTEVFKSFNLNSWELHGDSDNIHQTQWHIVQWDGHPIDSQLAKELSNYVFCAYVSLLLLNCSNIGTTTNAPLKKRKGKRMVNIDPEKLKYKTLIVRKDGKPIKHRTDTSDNQSTHGTIPLTQVDGCFKYYSLEKPLFGIPGNEQLIWVPEHIRGDKKNGVITHKEHIVKTK